MTVAENDLVEVAAGLCALQIAAVVKQPAEGPLIDPLLRGRRGHAGCAPRSNSCPSSRVPRRPSDSARPRVLAPLSLLQHASQGGPGNAGSGERTGTVPCRI